MANPPIIDSSWVIAMVVCGAIGVLVHIFLIVRSSPQMFTIKSGIKGKGKVMMAACILVFLFNGVACLIWLLFRTDILIILSITSCKFIYVANFLCYFTAKYILHCILIGRVFLVFMGTPYQINFKAILVFMGIVSIHFFVTIFVWTVEVFPNILKGIWLERYSICTLFSDNAQNTVNVKVCAILVGVEDFVVGCVTLFLILSRFAKIYRNTEDPKLLRQSIRYGTVAFIAVISTLFLFTLAIPFYPNATFIISVDAVINSLCVFCILSIGSKAYSILCFGCIYLEKQYMQKNIDANSTISKIVMHSHHSIVTSTPNKDNATSEITGNTKSQSGVKLMEKDTLGNKPVDAMTIPSLKAKQYSLQVNLSVEHLKTTALKNQRYAHSNPNPFI